MPAVGTWGFLGYALFRQTWLLQPVAVFGTFGLDLLIVLVNYALGMLLVAVLDRRRAHSERFGPMGEGALVPMRLPLRRCLGVAVACPPPRAPSTPLPPPSTTPPPL